MQSSTLTVQYSRSSESYCVSQVTESCFGWGGVAGSSQCTKHLVVVNVRATVQPF
jgi:hypothetical protein